MVIYHHRHHHHHQDASVSVVVLNLVWEGCAMRVFCLATRVCHSHSA